MIYPFWARSSPIKRSMFIFYPYKALYVNSAFSIYKLNFRKKCRKNLHPKKRLHPLSHLHQRRLHPRRLHRRSLHPRRRLRQIRRLLRILKRRQVICQQSLKRHLQPKRMSKPILKISILKNIKRLLRTLHGTHVLFQCILLCFDTLPLDRDIPLLDRDVLSLNDRDIPLLDRDVLSPDDRDIPLLDRDVLSLNDRDIPLLDRDVLSPDDRDIPLLDRDVLSPDDRDVLAPLLDDRDVLTLGIGDHDVRVLALGRDALRNALLCLVATKGLYSIPNTKLRHMWPNDRNC